MRQAPSDPLRPGPVYHGGDLTWARSRYPDAPQPWIDLSTGINPIAYPFAMPPDAVWQRLPDAELDRKLREAAAVAYGAAEPEMVVPAAGSQALVQLFPRLRSASRVAILGPTYGEHAASWSAAGHSVRQIDMLKHLPSDCDVVVVTNPNNPDGRVLAAEQLAAIASRLAARRGWLIVDEAFADVVPDVSLVPHIDHDATIVLRSFGKFFGLGGLRLGFAVTPPSLASVIRSALGPWAISGPAAWIGATALADYAWIDAMRSRLRAMRLQLDASLARHQMEIVGGTDLYRLATLPDAAGLFDLLCRHGIFARRFAEQPAWLRFGLPADQAAGDRLDHALEAWRRRPIHE